MTRISSAPKWYECCTSVFGAAVVFLHLCPDPAKASARRIFSPLSQEANGTAIHHQVRRNRYHKRVREPVDEIVARLEDENDDDFMPPLPVKRPVYPGEPPRGILATLPAKIQPEQPSKPPSDYGPPPPLENWTPSEIDAARAQCEKLMPSPDIAFKPAEPIKEGVCGLPAPIKVEAFTSERAPPLVLQSAPIMSCGLTAALKRWVDAVLQPSAKARLDATIISMNNVSAYVCRTRNNDPFQRMSQHASGNAFDVSQFVTAKGEVIDVLDHWNAGDERAAFLREIHAGACRIFGTTLGPEANAAHKDHFHFDIAGRRRGLCDFTGQTARK